MFLFILSLVVALVLLCLVAQRVPQDLSIISPRSHCVQLSPNIALV